MWETAALKLEMGLIFLELSLYYLIMAKPL
jgi:hypothetical protein